MMRRRLRLSALRALLAAGCVLCTAAGVAQTSKGVPNALQGFSENRNMPVQIEAAALEVRDREKIATFSGNVNVTQGDTNMKSRSLIVYYDQDAGPGGMKAAQPGPQGAQQIRKLEAKGSVVVTQKDQVATGDQGIFDMKANTVTLLGNVMVSKGQSVMRGERLVVNLETGVATVDSGKSNGPVRALFNTKDASTKDASKEAAKDGKPETRSEAGRGKDPVKLPALR